MAKQRKKKKSQPIADFKISKYIIEAAKKLPIHKVYLDPDTVAEQLGGIVVSRKRPNGEILFCSYILDLGCLGVKDTYYDILSEEEFDAFIIELGEDVESKFEETDINHAANLIYAGVEYADELGIDPVPEFDSVCIHMLPDVDDIEYIEIKCGKDGQPILRVQNDAKAQSYINKLTTAVGAGNFAIELFDEEDFEDEEWEDEEDIDYGNDDDDYTEFEEIKE